MRDVTICFTYFKSLGLDNLAAALCSVSRQDLSRVAAIVVVDNDGVGTDTDIAEIIAMQHFHSDVGLRLLSYKHGDPARTHSWSSNVAVREASTPWVFFTRADYLLADECLAKLLHRAPTDSDVFVTGYVYHLNADIAVCERAGWRERGPQALRSLPGAEACYVMIDAGVWLARREAFDRVGGLDEALIAWGHAQTHFQYKLHATGTEFVVVPEVLFYHPAHGAHRDLGLAHQQLKDVTGVDVRQMWARYGGPQPYGRWLP